MNKHPEVLTCVSANIRGFAAVFSITTLDLFRLQAAASLRFGIRLSGFDEATFHIFTPLPLGEAASLNISTVPLLSSAL